MISRGVEAPQPTSSALVVQRRVIGALILREIHSQFGNTKLGYLWAIINAGMSIVIFWGFREALGFHPPHGMSGAVFLLCGFIPWNMFSATVTRCLHAVDANSALLTFPQVTELDLMVGRLIVVWGTELVCALIILGVAILLGEPVELRHIESLSASLLFAPLLGLGGGMVFASLARIWPTLERIVPILIRLLFLSSGIFFQVSELPSRFAVLLLYNPVAQIIEWQRYGFSYSSQSPAYSVTYVAIWTLLSLFFGLLLERHVRGKNIR